MSVRILFGEIYRAYLSSDAGGGLTIITDPQIAFGEPTIRGIRTRAIAERYAAGEGILGLAKDYSIMPFDIEEALRYEIALPRRRGKQRSSVKDRT